MVPDRLYRLRRHAEDYLRACLETSDYVLAEKLEKEKEASPYHTSGSIDCRVPLVRVYQERGNTEQLRVLAKEFLLHDRLSYYPIQKERYDQKEWETVVDCLLDELQARAGAKHAFFNRQSPYPEALKAEGKQERLLTYVRKNPLLIQSY